MKTECILNISYRVLGKSGKVALSVSTNGTASKVFKVDILDEAKRAEACTAIFNEFPGLDESIDGICLSDELLRVADEVVSAGDRKSGSRASVQSSTGLAGQTDSEELLAAMSEDICKEAEVILADPMLIKKVIDDVAALGVAGERELIATIYLIGISRLLDQPLAAIIQGPSSSGKSYAIQKTVELFPEESVIHATQMTPQALFHMPPRALVHKFVVAGERSRVKSDEAAEATRALREMLSAGKLTKLLPMKVEGGQIETVQINQDGPIAFIESTTSARVFDEDANRCVMLHTDEQSSQTRRIINKLALGYCGNATVCARDRVILRHHALQRMLEPRVIAIPFASRLAELFTTDRVDVRRAFPQLMSMIQAVVLLYQKQRETDGDGRLIAIPDDYQLARHLLVKPFSRMLGSGLSDPARRFCDRLIDWFGADAFTTPDAKNKETGSKSSVYGWIGELHGAGLVEMIEPHRGPSPTRWRLNSVGPSDIPVNGLPSIEEVFPKSEWTHGHKVQLVTQQEV